MMFCGFNTQVHGKMVLTQVLVTACLINQPAFHEVISLRCSLQPVLEPFTNQGKRSIRFNAVTSSTF
jgi:hypothetical protein